MIEFEQMQIEHAERFHALLESVARDSPYLGIAVTPSLAQVKERVEFALRHHHPMFVARHGEALVGWCFIHLNPEPGFQHNGSVFVGVREDFRRCGIGKSLILMAVSNAWKARVCRVELEVCTSNRAAIELYRSLGFVEEGMRRNAYLVDGVYENVTVMSLLRTDDVAAVLPRAA